MLPQSQLLLVLFPFLQQWAPFFLFSYRAKYFNHFHFKYRVPMIGLALSIDFALLLINRYKEELHTKSIREAIQISVTTAGRSIIFSGLCVFIGLSALWFIQIDIFQNVALGGITIVLISALLH